MVQRKSARRVRQAINALVRRFQLAERADVACCGTTVAQAATLQALASYGDLRSSDLCRHLGIAPSTLTRNLDRLEGRGLIRRAADPTDRRVARVHLTDSGVEAAREIDAAELEFIGEVLAHLEAAGVTNVVPVLEALEAAVRSASERCCPGAYDDSAMIRET
jgi:DNA-binding MarR family transcriptional regulator